MIYAVQSINNNSEVQECEVKPQQLSEMKCHELCLLERNQNAMATNASPGGIRTRMATDALGGHRGRCGRRRENAIGNDSVRLSKPVLEEHDSAFIFDELAFRK